MGGQGYIFAKTSFIFLFLTISLGMASELKNRKNFSYSRKYGFLSTGVLFFLFAGWLYLLFPINIFPAEDATILYQFSENFAQTGIISYNFLGEPAEGATDFLWMVLISLGNVVGWDSYFFACLLSLLALLACVGILIKLFSGVGHKELAFFAAIALLVNSQGLAAVQGFSVVFFGSLLLLCLYGFVQKSEKLLIISALICGLVRPDGLVVTAPLVLIYLLSFAKDKQHFFLQIILYAILPGSLYFLWRWWYFGYFFPLPFYVKGGNAGMILNPSSLLYETKYLFKYLWPLWGFLLYRFFHYKKSPQAFFYSNKTIFSLLVCFVLIPLVFFSRIELEQNIADRFMYPVHLGILICFLLSIVPAAMQDFLLGFKRAAFFSGFLYLGFSAMYFIIFLKGTMEIAQDTNVFLAKDLGEIQRSRIATTEAGRLAYYTKWKTMDLWGLNSPSLAQRVVQAQDLETFDPDVMLIDLGAWYREVLEKADRPYQVEKTWDNMAFNSFKYAWESDAYEFWMLPFKQDEGLEPWMENYVASIQVIIDLRLKLSGSQELAAHDMYHMYAVRKMWGHKGSVVSVLQKYGGIPFQEYLGTFEPQNK